MERRGKGEGSVYFDKAKQKWISQFVAGRRDDGKVIKRSFSGDTKKEAIQKMNEAQCDIRTNSYVKPDKITFGSLAEYILQNKYEMNIIGDNTFYRDTMTMEHVRNSELYKMPMQEVTHVMLQKFMTSKVEYSQSFIDKFYQLLNAICKYAVRYDYIIRNPMDKVDKPRSKKQVKNVIAFTVEEEKRFLAQLEHSSYKHILGLLIHTGMRVGECLALKRSDINFEEKTIHIQRTLTRTANGKTIVGTKTKTYEGDRKIPITPIVRTILLESIINVVPNEQDLIFYKNTQIIPHEINQEVKRVARDAGILLETSSRLKKAGDESTRVKLYTSSAHTHMLRHTYATRCIEAEMPPVVLQKLLGHKDIKVTMNTYGYIFDALKEKETQKYTEYMDKIVRQIV